MDVDFWASRVHSAKHLSAVQAHTENHIFLDDSEGDDDVRTCFPCPFCYMDIELPVLCSHLQEEHCFDVKNAVCPLCAANLGKDVIGHFTMQHTHSLKRRRKGHRSGFWTNSSVMLGKELRGLNSYLGTTPANSGGNPHECAPDPLLSPFICSLPVSNPKGTQQDKCSTNDSLNASSLKSTEPTLGDEGQEEDYEEKSRKAAFIQQLILSTIF